MWGGQISWRESQIQLLILMIEIQSYFWSIFDSTVFGQTLCLRIYSQNPSHRHDAGYLGDFLTVKPPESLAIEDRFMVEWEYTLFSLVPRRRKIATENEIILRNQTNVRIGRGHGMTQTRANIGTIYPWNPWQGYEIGQSHLWTQSWVSASWHLGPW